MSRADDLCDQGFGRFAAHQVLAALDLHHPRRTQLRRCIAAGADYDFHECGDRCYVDGVLCNGCGVEFEQCSTRKAMATACPHAFDDGADASAGDPCVWCDGVKT